MCSTTSLGTAAWATGRIQPSSDRPGAGLPGVAKARSREGALEARRHARINIDCELAQQVQRRSRRGGARRSPNGWLRLRVGDCDELVDAPQDVRLARKDRRLLPSERFELA